LQGELKDKRKWEEKLKNFDPDLKYHPEGFVYNLDITDKQLSRMIIMNSTDKKKKEKADSRLSPFDFQLDDGVSLI
jgi:CRISPR/Cas system-associated protein endoribonuclease Cas2